MAKIASFFNSKRRTRLINMTGRRFGRLVALAACWIIQKQQPSFVEMPV